MLLPAGGRNAELLFLQAVRAPFVERNLVGNNGYEATIPYVVDDSLLIEVDLDIESPSISFISETGTLFLFSTAILRGGFLKGLKGRCSGNLSWPKKWSMASLKIQDGERLLDWIPNPVCDKRALDELFRWCLISSSEIEGIARGNMIMKLPCTEHDVLVCEDRLRLTLGSQYRDFLKITNGLGVRHQQLREILGSQDIDYIDDSRQWLGVVPLHEDGIAVLRCENGRNTNECFFLKPGGELCYWGEFSYVVHEIVLGHL